MSLWFEYLAVVQRPDTPDEGDDWSSDAAHTQLAVNVPCQFELDTSRDRGPVDVRTWTVFVQLEDARSRDRVVVNGHVFDALSAERFYWPDGTYSHNELVCEEVANA